MYSMRPRLLVCMRTVFYVMKCGVKYRLTQHMSILLVLYYVKIGVLFRAHNIRVRHDSPRRPILSLHWKCMSSFSDSALNILNHYHKIHRAIINGYLPFEQGTGSIATLLRHQIGYLGGKAFSLTSFRFLHES